MPGRSEVVLKCSQHAEALVQGIAELKADNLLSDCILTLNDTKYHVHKCILASFSPYFKTLFTSKGTWKESNNPEITLNHINNHHFEAILQYIYNGVICLNMKTIAEIWATSDMLQMLHLQKVCHDYLINQISPSNCIGIWKHARQFNDVQLEQLTYQYIITNMEEVSHYSEFLEIGHEELLFCFSGNQADKDESSTSLLQTKDNSHADMAPSLSCMEGHIQPSHIPEPCLMVAGGYKRGLVTTCEKFCPESQTWKKMSTLSLVQSKHYHWIGSVGLRIYAMTGDSPLEIDAMESVLSPQVVKHLQTKSLGTGWEHESTIAHDCSNMSFCVLNDCIYGCGIFLQNALLSSDNVDSPMKICRYSPSEAHWDISTLAMASRAMFQLEAHNGRLLFIGGLDVVTQQAIASFQAYHPGKESLEELANMNHCRYNFGTSTFGRHLYAVGGCGLNDRLLDSVENYNFETETWCEWIFLPRPRACMACTTVGGALYCVGGEEYSNETTTVQVDALVIELASRTWKYASPLSCPRRFLHILKV